MLFGGDLRLVAVEELGQDLATEDLDRLHDVLVLVAAGLQHEDHLVDAGFLESTEVLAHLGRRADAAAQPGRVACRLLGAECVCLDRSGNRVGVVALRSTTLDVLRPHIGLAGLMVAEDVEVAERVAEEVGALGATTDGLVLVVVQHHRADTGDLRIDVEADRVALLSEGALVLGDPVDSLFGIDEGERQRAHALLGGQQDRFAATAGHPQRWVRLLHRLGDDVARWHLHVLAVDAGERGLGHAAHGHLETLEPLLALVQRIHAEAAELCFARRLATAELDPPARYQVEHADPLGGARRMVELRRSEDDAVAEAHVLGALAACREEDLGRGGVAVLLQEVVLDLPDVLDAERVGQLDLVERVRDQLVLGAVVPGSPDLVLVEDAELHGQPAAAATASTN